MAELMIVSGVADDLFDILGRWMRRLPGGLAIATALSGAAFGAVSGSSTAAAATLSASSVPTMIRRGYDPAFASGVVAISGTLAMLIPPSIALILYGLLSGANIGALLVAGVIPGILVTLVIIGTILFLVWRDPTLAPRNGPADEAPGNPWSGLSFLVLFVAVTGVIYVGIATPTEASALGAFGALCIAAAKGKLDWRTSRLAFYKAARSTAMIAMIIIGAQVFGYFLTLTQVPQEIVASAGGLGAPRWLVLIVILFVYLVLGCFLDQIAILILTVPIILPLVTQLGYDPIWFGVLIIVMAEIGLVTPPVGINVFVVSRYTGVPMEKVFLGVTPHVIVHFVAIALLVLFPSLVLWLPSTM
jgi:tripartite ATP-independent transporter DctM subunit